MLGKVTSGQEAHGAPPGFYFVLFWVTFWPGSVLAGLAAPAVWQSRREPGAQFLLAWLVPSWLVFEAVMTKLPHYVLPLYPAIAILIAGILESGDLSKSRWLVRGTIGWFLFPGAIAIAVLIAFIMFGRRSRAHRLAVFRARGDLRPVRLVALRRRWCRTLVVAWHGRLGAGRDHGLCGDVALLPSLFPSAMIAEEIGMHRLPAAARCLDIRLSGAEPGVSAGHRYALHRRGGCCRLPARRAMPFRFGRSAQRAQLRATRRIDRIALFAQPARLRGTISASASRSR